MRLAAIDEQLLKQIAGLHGTPPGAYNIRKNGAVLARESKDGITITPKTGKPGIDIRIEPGVLDKSVHIPVIMTEGGLHDLVYNTFEIGAGSDVLIVAGCGIHNPSGQKSQHDGIHEFFVRKGAKIRYIEKHYGEGGGTGERVLNPVTILHLEEGATAELELVQVRGIDHTVRETEVHVAAHGHLLINERLLTHESQRAESKIVVHLEGDESSGEVLSRSVGQGDSFQSFEVSLIGYTKCKGHVACDSIIMDRADIRAKPELWAKNAAAELTHEAAIGRLAGDQIIKLMTFGMTEEEAVKTLLQAYLK
ncbi:MAG: SufD family Fe-S cluster assembly protein [Firmicutes bacterium]|nr:SufD family Fe-S cluster assembly protein [Bacillota bacterium]